MWINFFTVALAMALGCGVMALYMQNDPAPEQAAPRRRRRMRGARG